MRFYVRSVGMRLLGAASAVVVFAVLVVIGLQMEEGDQTLEESVFVLMPMIVVAVLLLVGIVAAVGVWIAAHPSPPSWGAFLFGVGAAVASLLVLPLVVSPVLQAVATALALLLPWPRRREILAPQPELQGR